MRGFLFIGLFLWGAVSGLQARPYFFLNRDYGSEYTFHPLSVMINGSYDFAQINGTRRIWNYEYQKNTQTVFDNIFKPWNPVSDLGTKKFISTEVFPFSLDRKGAQWIPNYQLHLLGGGRTYAALAEWYEAHNVSYPKLAAFTTTFAYQFLNEVVENDRVVGYTVDPVADIWIFNPAGIILFSIEPVQRFFSDELHFADWSWQPGFSMQDGTIQNVGQKFSMKWKLPYQEPFHLFTYFGLGTLFGVSYKFSNGDAISVGGGVRPKGVQVVNAKKNTRTVDLTWMTGLFYDRKDSLMASLFVSELVGDTVNLNIYPGLVKMGSLKPGFWFGVGGDKIVYFGISILSLPGMTFSTK